MPNTPLDHLHTAVTLLSFYSPALCNGTCAWWQINKQGVSIILPTCEFLPGVRVVLSDEVAATLQLAIFQCLVVVFVLDCYHLQVLQL